MPDEKGRTGITREVIGPDGLSSGKKAFLKHNYTDCGCYGAGYRTRIVAPGTVEYYICRCKRGQALKEVVDHGFNKPRKL